MPNHLIAPNSRFYVPQPFASQPHRASVSQPAVAYLPNAESAGLPSPRIDGGVRQAPSAPYPTSTLVGLPMPQARFKRGAEVLPTYHEMQDVNVNAQPTPSTVGLSASMHNAAPRPDASTLGAFNHALESVRRDINNTMTPAQRRLGRTLTIIGSLAALGGGVTAGLLGLGALGAAASAVGLPVAAVAGIAAAAVFIGGTAVAVTTGAVVRSLVRKSLEHDPALQEKLAAVRTIRDQLAQRKHLNKGEKKLLRNANRVLGKVEGFRMQFKSQAKLAGKTQGIAAFSFVFLALGAMAVASGGFGSGGGDGLLGSGDTFSAKGSHLGGAFHLPVDVQNGEALLSTLTQRASA